MDFFSLAMGMMNLLDASSDEITSSAAGQFRGMASRIFEIAKDILIPVMIIVGVAGIFYSIYLGVNMARADSSDKREEAKKRLVNAIIGFVVIFILILLLFLFCQNADTIFGWTKTATIADGS